MAFVSVNLDCLFGTWHRELGILQRTKMSSNLRIKLCLKYKLSARECSYDSKAAGKNVGEIDSEEDC